MYSKKICIPILLLSALLLTSCDNEPHGATVKDKNTTTITIDKEKLGISDIDLQRFTIKSSAEEVIATSQKIELNKEFSDVIALVDDGGEPVLLARKFSGDISVDLSLASTAEVMVLTSPHFTGRASTDPKELSRRIRSHSGFQGLMDSIESAITSGNPCPVSPACNSYSARLSMKLADDLDINDLYETGK